MSREFRSDEYDRPNHPWKCGGEVEGLPCPLGPSRLGVCRSQCTPIQEGDRYFCANASDLSGDCDSGPLPDGTCGHFPHRCSPRKKGRDWVCTLGACTDGPLPDGQCSRTFSCAPVRTLAYKRRIVVVTTVAIAISLLLLATSRPGSRVGDLASGVLSSGPLSAHHQAAAKCDQCHEAGQGNLNDWVHLALGAEQGVSQSEKCLECHTEIGREEDYALLAHGMPPAELSARASDQNSSSFVPILLRVARLQKPDAHRKLACATCHDEHRGREFDITQISNRQCQVCHTEAFHSFEHGHPEFASYPHGRRSATYFDHATHYRVHFANYARTAPDGVSPTDGHQPSQPIDAVSCNSCHVLDDSGQEMLVRSFEHSCASCHGHQIADSKVSVIRVPLSHDPAAVARFVERRENGFMRVLLPGEELTRAREVLRNYTPAETTGDRDDQLVDGEQDQTGPTDQAEASLREAAKTYVDGLTEVVRDLADGNRDGLAARLQTSGVTPEQSRQLATLLGVDDVAVREQLKATSPVAIDQPEWAIDIDLDHWNLSYRVSHGDLNQDRRLRFMQEWLEASAAKSSAESLADSAAGNPVGPFEQLFADLAAPAASGRCLKCHSAEDAGEGLRVLWAQHGRSEFTAFDHAPHLPPRNNNYDCIGCHQLDSALMKGELDFFRTAYQHNNGTINTNPSTVCTSGFSPLTKSQCVHCHRKETGNDSCLTCHNYHVRH